MIDIIIPTYNSYDTIERTLNSINIQTIKDKVNIYIIDDCSDKSYDYLIDKFESLNINVFRMDKNNGPGVARNKGLDISSGDYVFFIDSDDEIIHNVSLERMLNCFEDKDVDIVSGIVAVVYSDDDIRYILNQERCLHAKMYRRSFIDKYKFRFNEKCSYRHEDFAFNFLCLYSNPNVKLLKYPIYKYNNTDDSLTTLKDIYSGFKSYELLCINTLWSIKEGEKRGFDKKIITEKLNETLMFLYFTYEIYYNEPFKDELLDWTKALKKYYNDNRDIINHNKLSKINYDMFDRVYYYDHHITWNDFINQ